uniref:Uncharacterized protein n=1 Tax=Arundo donax TaxID=35708 RepID=A0A0A9HBK4_ARUDO
MPARTPCRASVTTVMQTKGSMVATKDMTSSSLLYARPTRRRAARRAPLTITASITAMDITTRTAERAPSGFPAPSSFATRVLPAAPSPKGIM